MSELAYRIPIKELKLLYLDDEKKDLENFISKVNIYNTSIDNDDAVKLRVQTFEGHVEAIGAMEKDRNGYDVFICDHNMPGQKGLQIINYIKIDNPDMVFVLYTGAGNLSYEIKKHCKDNDILYFEKTEEFSTLIGQIVNRSHRSTNNPLEKLYYRLTNEIIADMHKIEKADPSFRLQIGSKVLKPSQLINELNNRTKIGFDYIDSYISGLIFFK